MHASLILILLTLSTASICRIQAFKAKIESHTNFIAIADNGSAERITSSKLEQSVGKPAKRPPQDEPQRQADSSSTVPSTKVRPFFVFLYDLMSRVDSYPAFVRGAFVFADTDGPDTGDTGANGKDGQIRGSVAKLFTEEAETLQIIGHKNNYEIATKFSKHEKELKKESLQADEGKSVVGVQFAIPFQPGRLGIVRELPSPLEAFINGELTDEEFARIRKRNVVAKVLDKDADLQAAFAYRIYASQEYLRTKGRYARQSDVEWMTYVSLKSTTSNKADKVNRIMSQGGKLLARAVNKASLGFVEETLAFERSERNSTMYKPQSGSTCSDSGSVDVAAQAKKKESESGFEYLKLRKNDMKLFEEILKEKAAYDYDVGKNAARTDDVSTDAALEDSSQRTDAALEDSSQRTEAALEDSSQRDASISVQTKKSMANVEQDCAFYDDNVRTGSELFVPKAVTDALLFLFQEMDEGTSRETSRTSVVDAAPAFNLENSQKHCASDFCILIPWAEDFEAIQKDHGIEEGLKPIIETVGGKMLESIRSISNESAATESKKLREQKNKINKATHAAADTEKNFVTGVYTLRELKGNASGGKSGSDINRYEFGLFKSLGALEFKAFTSFVPDYLKYMNDRKKAGEFTSLVRIFGVVLLPRPTIGSSYWPVKIDPIKLCKIAAGTRYCPAWFLMGWSTPPKLVGELDSSVFKKSRTQEYDLKGSKHGRRLKIDKGEKGPKKDLDLEEDLDMDKDLARRKAFILPGKAATQLGKEVQRSDGKEVLKSIERDSALLRHYNFIDYSLLVKYDTMELLQCSSNATQNCVQVSDKRFLVPAELLENLHFFAPTGNCFAAINTLGVVANMCFNIIDFLKHYGFSVIGTGALIEHIIKRNQEESSVKSPTYYWQRFNSAMARYFKVDEESYDIWELVQKQKIVADGVALES